MICVDELAGPRGLQNLVFLPPINRRNALDKQLSCKTRNIIKKGPAYFFISIGKVEFHAKESDKSLPK